MIFRRLSDKMAALCVACLIPASAFIRPEWLASLAFLVGLIALLVFLGRYGGGLHRE